MDLFGDNALAYVTCVNCFCSLPPDLSVNAKPEHLWRQLAGEKLVIITRKPECIIYNTITCLGLDMTDWLCSTLYYCNILMLSPYT